MPARFNAYPPDRAALMRLLDDDGSYRIGRDPACELCIDHASVSRLHATIQGAGFDWNLRDDASKNGLRVNGESVAHARVRQATWFAIGDVHCSLEPIDAAAAARVRQQQDSRRVVSRWLSARLSPSLGVDTLISQTLDVVLELVGFDRGFVLYARQGDALRVRAQRGLVARDIADAAFAGSATAVDQALRSGHSVVCCDTTESPWLGARPSVRLGGIRALLCVPLQVARDSLGALYADSRRPGPPVTELDLELIQTVASHVAAVLSARELRGDMAQLLRAAADAGLDAPRWDELHKAPAGQTKSRVDEE